MITLNRNSLFTSTGSAHKQGHYIRHLEKSDLDKVYELEQTSDSYYYVSDFIKEEYSIVYGLFLDDKLIGFCTLGGAEELDTIEPDFDYDSLLLSDVYIAPEYRHKHFGSQMITELLKAADVPVYCVILSDDLAPFYEQLGFTYMKDGVLKRNVETIKTMTL